MIKFFRRIRQRLISEGKLKNYTLYAIGEIFLVVVGILIALQINNWSEQNKTHQRQLNYLQQIHTELNHNLNSVTQEREKVRSYLAALRKFVALGDSTLSVVSEDEISSTWRGVFSGTAKFQYEDGALLELISSGGLKDIKNDSIRNILAALEGMVQKVRNQEQDYNSYIKKGNNYLEKNGSFRTLTGGKWWGIGQMKEQKSNKFLLESQEFENILVFAIGNGQYLYDGVYSHFEKDLRTLIAMIDKELE
jgi:hypothetical protein